jgi:leader peptidase (prepilin peptidase) / N-methyltransferase
MLDNVLIILLAPLIGSFVAVVVTRYSNWRAIAIGRSRCPRCGRTLAARDLVPIVSWLVQRGRCRFCAGPIGVLYLRIELAALAIAVWAACLVPGPLLAITCGLGWTLLALGEIDARRFVLPDVITGPLLLSGLAVAWLYQPDQFLDHVLGAAAGYLSFFLLSDIYRRLRGRVGLGLGDAKLFAAAGAWVSWLGLPSIALIAGASGLATVLLHSLAKSAPIEPGSRLPFGPFLAFGLWIVWLYGPLVLGY